jgi:sterol 22-desaturase
METAAASFASPLASVRDGNLLIPPQIEYVVDASNASLWTIAFTILAVLVAYDQSMSIVLGKHDG